MDSQHVSSYFGKYGKLPTPQRVVKLLLEEFLGVPRCIQSVSVQQGILFVKASSGVKQALHFREKELLTFLKDQNISVAVRELR